MNLYILQDNVSKIYGEVFESPNDETCRRSMEQFIRLPSSAGIPVSDIVVIRIGRIDKNDHMPVIYPEPIGTVIFRGDEINRE